MTRALLILTVSTLSLIPALASAQDCAAPEPPILSASISKGVVSLAWAPSDDSDLFVFEAGNVPGGANIVYSQTSARRLVIGVGSGTFWVRVRAVNTCGISEPSKLSEQSKEWKLQVPCNDPVPALSISNGMFKWNPRAGSERVAYFLEIATEPGGATNMVMNVGGSSTIAVDAIGLFDGIGTGTYYARLRGATACGGALTSNEVAFTVIR